MNAITTLVIVILISLGLFALIPLFTFGIIFIAFAGMGLIWFLPIILIAASDQTSGGEKAAWILAIIFLSWFAWVFYFFLAPLKPKARHYRHRTTYDY